MASVRKRDPKDPNSPWVCEYTDAGGKRHRITPKTGLKKDAEAARRKIEAELERGEHLSESDSPSIRKLCDDFMKSQEDRLRDGRIGRTRYHQIKVGVDKSIIPYLGGLKLKDLTTPAIEDHYRKLRTVGKLSAMTARDRMFTLKMVESFAIKRGLLKKTPVTEGLRELRGIKGQRIRTFSVDQVQALLRVAANPKWPGVRKRAAKLRECMIHLAACCGLRFGEIIALLPENIDLDRRFLRVRHNLTAYGELKGPKTPAGVRDVPIPEHLADMLRAWAATYYGPNRMGLFFTNNEGNPVKAQDFHRNSWEPLLRKAGLLDEGPKFHFHALRHFASSWMIENNLPVTEVASLMGHEKFDVTLQVYAHPVVGGNRRQDAIDRMAKGLLVAPEIAALATSNATQMRLAPPSN